MNLRFDTNACDIIYTSIKKTKRKRKKQSKQRARCRGENTLLLFIGLGLIVRLLSKFPLRHF